MGAGYVGLSIALVGPSGAIFGLLAAVRLLLMAWIFVMDVLMWPAGVVKA